MQAPTLKPLPTRLNPGCLTLPYHSQNRPHTCHSNTPNAQMLEAIAPGTQIDCTARDQVALALQKHPELIAMLRGRTDPTSLEHQLSGIEWTEISDGRINYVYELRGCEGALLVKHAAPHVKSVGPAFPLSQTRMDVEAAAMQAVHAICPQHTPSLELYDPHTCTLAMQYLDGYIKLQDAIHSQQQCLWAFSHLAELMAGYLHGTSAAALGDAAVEEAAARFANTDIVKANIVVVFDDPWDAGCLCNRWPSELDDGVMKMRSSPQLRDTVARLRSQYLTQRACLIHNDLHPANVLVRAAGTARSDTGFRGCSGSDDIRSGSNSSSSTARHSQHGGPCNKTISKVAGSFPDDNDLQGHATCVLDWEFATYGPPAYDLGSLLGNLLLAWCVEVSRADAGAHQPMDATNLYTLFDTSERPQPSTANHSAAQCGFATPCPGLFSVQGSASSSMPQGAPDSADGSMAAASIKPERPGCYPTWLMGAMESLLMEFLGSYAAKASGKCVDAAGSLRPSQSRDGTVAATLSQLVRDSAGFAGVCMARLTFGMHHYTGMELLPHAQRINAEGRALAVASALLRWSCEQLSQLEQEGYAAVYEPVSSLQAAYALADTSAMVTPGQAFQGNNISVGSFDVNARQLEAFGSEPLPANTCVNLASGVPVHAAVLVRSMLEAVCEAATH